MDARQGHSGMTDGVDARQRISGMTKGVDARQGTSGMTKRVVIPAVSGGENLGASPYPLQRGT